MGYPMHKDDNLILKNIQNIQNICVWDKWNYYTNKAKYVDA